eukprot:PhM_4_TR7180/c0_g1_i1/m.29963
MFSRYSYSRNGMGFRDTDVASGDMPVEYPLYTKTSQYAGDIPVRLSHVERKAMRLVRGVINASQYTDRVDQAALVANPGKRRQMQLKEIFSVCVGFIAGMNQSDGLALLSEPRLERHQSVLQQLFEFTRRYKILNPDLMRTDYAKVLYLLQDSVIPENKEELGFDLVSDIHTVRSYLERKRIASLLDDELLPLCSTPVPRIRDRTQLNKALRYKELAVQKLVAKYANVGGVSKEEVELAIYSIADANQYATDNAECVFKFVSLLREHFNPDAPFAPEFDLGITEGESGSRLTHNHKDQFYFVQQTLTFWKNILLQMFSLWTIAERDILNGELPYVYEETGQGYHRLQRNSAATRAALQQVLDDTKQEVGVWVGSDRIHLGDPQVPNGMYFLDKYAQISRIVNPILRVIEYVDTLVEDRRQDSHLRHFITHTWKSADYLKKAILTDFLRHGFDGSGGDNMDDAGSCIDGRLTSAWNWCNDIHLKPFYPVFLLAGFHSFDGDLHT